MSQLSEKTDFPPQPQQGFPPAQQGFPQVQRDAPIGVPAVVIEQPGLLTMIFQLQRSLSSITVIVRSLKNLKMFFSHSQTILSAGKMRSRKPRPENPLWHVRHYCCSLYVPSRVDLSLVNFPF
jgi:hypothetical protein